MMLDKEEHRKRYQLWAAGLSDSEIAKRCFSTRGAIQSWRANNGLDANYSSGRENMDQRKFSTGAVRDNADGKGRFDLLPWYGIWEVAKHCEQGAKKYGERNVDKGIPASCLLDSCARHLARLISGEHDEDHARAVAWNILWYLQQRTTHPDLDDMPKPAKPKLGPVLDADDVERDLI